MTKESIRIHVRRSTTAEMRKLGLDRRRLYHEIGQLVHRWGLLQEHLAGVFSQANESSKPVSDAMWHSLKSDLVQRQILVAALKARITLLAGFNDDVDKQQRVKAYTEYVWAVEEITKFSHRRNDVIHSPLVFFLAAGADEHEVRVLNTYNNPRAKTLKDKELYQLLRWLNHVTTEMVSFLSNLWPHIRKHNRAPTRPKFRPMSDFPTRAQPPERKRAKRVYRKA